MVLMRLIKGIPCESKERKGTNKKRIFLCPTASREFETKFFWSSQIGRRSGIGKITKNYCNELVTTLGGSPASETLSYGSSTTYFNDNINADDIFDHPSSSNSNSLFS